MSDQSRKAFDNWFNNNFRKELIESPQDVEQDWWVWQAAIRWDGEKFCDDHCTWLDHKNDCPLNNDPTHK